MERKIRVGAVSYLNTKPLIYGFQQGMMADSMELIEEYPAKIAGMLLNDEIDVGLVPVAIIPSLKEHHIISDYCIGSIAPVDSVCLFSDVPVEEINTILLDYQSRTSVALLKILLKEYWKISPQLVIGKDGYEADIKGSVAGLVIGDRAFKQRKLSAHIYDLASAWKEMTGLPFVFAVWLSNKKLPETFISSFNDANMFGMEHLDEIIKTYPDSDFDLHHYYHHSISYLLDEAKRKALSLFLSKLPPVIG